MPYCLRCGKKIDEFPQAIIYSVAYDKCRGKTCPDCGKVRKLGWHETVITEDHRFRNPCIKCKRITGHWIDKLCGNCFIERERKRGCVCIYDNDYDESKGHHNNINYYCPLCEESHPRDTFCKECFEKQTVSYQRKQTFFKVFLPTAIISLIIGFFLGWLFFKKLRKTKKKSD